MDNPAQIYSAGLWTVKDGKEAEFAAAWERFAAWTVENQPGAIRGTLLQDVEDEHRFISFGPWRDFESIKAWRQTPVFADFLATAKELCEDVQPRSLRWVAGVGQKQEAI